MVLSLPLVPFERYMLADDRPAYPMNSFMRLRFSGRFDRVALDAAMSTAVSRHPLLAAVAQRSGRRWLWRSANDLPTIQWLDALPAESLPSLKPLDVRITSGMRVAVCEGPGQTDVVLQVHHACCDGLGMFAFAKDLLVAYAMARGAAPATSLRPLQPEQLRARGRFGLTTGQLFRMLPSHLAGLRGARKFLMRTPEPLVPHQPSDDDSPLPPDYPVSWTRQLELTESKGLVAAARRLGVSTNDLLVRDFFLALNDWQQRRAPHRDRKWLRLTVPVNLRTMADRRLPAGNVVSMVFLDRNPREMMDPQRLLESIRQQIQLIKRLQLGLTFVLSVQVCGWLPGGLRRMTRAKRCMATSVLTNLGPVLAHCPLPYEEGRLVVGDAVLQSIDGLAPLRPLTCAAVVLMVYAGRFQITLHYDSRVLTATDAGELIDEFTARVRQSAVPRQTFVGIHP